LVVLIRRFWSSYRWVMVLPLASVTLTVLPASS
jgi:hypothetical protein